MAKDNGQVPSDEAKKLIGKDYKEKVGSLQEQRMMSRAFIRNNIGEFDPENISIARRHQMRRDPMIQLGLHYCKFPLIRSKWSIECADPRIAAGLTEIIREVKSSYTRSMLMALDFGFQGSLKQFELGKIDAEYIDEQGNTQPVWDAGPVQPMVLGNLLPLLPEWTRVEIEDGAFVGINTMFSSSDPDDQKFVPIEWCLWSVNEFEENWRSYYGYPRTGYAYRYWWSYWFRFYMEDRHFEQDADPALMIQYPPGLSDDGKKTNREVALEIGNDLRGGATIAWPSDVHVDEQGKGTTTPLWAAEFLQGGENLDAFRQSNEYLDVMKLRSVLVPEQALVEGKGGTSSRNVGATYGEIFQQSLGQMAEDLDKQWNDHVIPQLVEANWGADAPKARIQTSGFDEEDLTLANELIKIAFQLDPNALPINFDDLIDMANLPKLSPQEQQEREQELQEYQQQQAMQAMMQRRQQQQASFGEDPEMGLAQADAPRPMHMFLHQGQEKVKSTAPLWAREEQERRDAALGPLAQRLEGMLAERYRRLIEATALEIERSNTTSSQSLSLAFRRRSRVRNVEKWLNKLIDRILGRVRREDPLWVPNLQDAEAAMFHAAGSQELTRLDQNLDYWDIQWRSIQNWATGRAEFLTEGTNEYGGLDESFVRIHVRPYLQEQFKQVSYEFDEEEALRIANDVRQHFSEFPAWMAERVARTEARHAYNKSAFMVWERSGIQKVKAFDGLGGRSGITDPVCLARNGAILTMEEAKREDDEEHPNGTLGFVPVIPEEIYYLPIEQWEDIEKELPNG